MCFLRHSEFISESDKKKRFTEAYTVKMATFLIKELEKENERLGGGARVRHGIMKVKKLSKKKASNAFIRFSTMFRSVFVSALTTAQNVSITGIQYIRVYVYKGAN